MNEHNAVSVNTAQTTSRPQLSLENSQLSLKLEWKWNTSLYTAPPARSLGTVVRGSQGALMRRGCGRLWLTGDDHQTQEVAAAWVCS